MKIALVTLHYKNLSDTIGLLQSLKKAKVPKGNEVTVYVVDNEGSEGLARVIETDFPACQLVKSGKNLGFSGGNNLGFSKAL
ncbi:glycosyltransferase family 2 protein, partial [Candidatus Collierbacteria bacterium]|nr:glycosyltransferase family 2 protein [Candidatus Collierbacteria bacterium]